MNKEEIRITEDQAEWIIQLEDDFFKRGKYWEQVLADKVRAARDIAHQYVQNFAFFNPYGPLFSGPVLWVKDEWNEPRDLYFFLQGVYKEEEKMELHQEEDVLEQKSVPQEGSEGDRKSESNTALFTSWYNQEREDNRISNFFFPECECDSCGRRYPKERKKYFLETMTDIEKKWFTMKCVDRSRNRLSDYQSGLFFNERAFQMAINHPEIFGEIGEPVISKEKEMVSLFKEGKIQKAVSLLTSSLLVCSESSLEGEGEEYVMVRNGSYVSSEFREIPNCVIKFADKTNPSAIITVEFPDTIRNHRIYNMVSNYIIRVPARLEGEDFFVHLYDSKCNRSCTSCEIGIFDKNEFFISKERQPYFSRCCMCVLREEETDVGFCLNHGVISRVGEWNAQFGGLFPEPGVYVWYTYPWMNFNGSGDFSFKPGLVGFSPLRVTGGFPLSTTMRGSIGFVFDWVKGWYKIGSYEWEVIGIPDDLIMGLSQLYERNLIELVCFYFIESEVWIPRAGCKRKRESNSARSGVKKMKIPL